MWTTKPARAIAAFMLVAGATLAPARAADWTPEQKDVLRSLWIGSLEAPGPSSSNRWAQDPKAADLGRRLFFDPKLSHDGSVSCASCHDPDRAFTDGRRHAQGLGDAQRNTPSVIGTAHYPWLYWDGRRDSLWAQALTPLEAQDEMGNTRTGIVRLITRDPDLSAAYEAVFGPMPAGLPVSLERVDGGPFGTPDEKTAWARARGEDRDRINQVFVAIGKAIAAYERTLAHTPSRFDQYVEAILSGGQAGRADALSPDEIAGLELFIDDAKTRCLRCHNGPLFTNFDFHNVGTGTFEGPHLDFGRMFGVRAALIDEFNCFGAYSDARKDECASLRFLARSDHASAVPGAFKVPSLRNVAETTPYMHDGRHASLQEVIAHYREPADQADAPHELLPITLTDREAAQLEAFLESLSDGPATEH